METSQTRHQGNSSSVDTTLPCIVSKMNNDCNTKTGEVVTQNSGN